MEIITVAAIHLRDLVGCSSDPACGNAAFLLLVHQDTFTVQNCGHAVINLRVSNRRKRFLDMARVQFVCSSCLNGRGIVRYSSL